MFVSYSCSGQMHRGCQGRYRSHQFHHRHSQSKRRKRGFVLISADFLVGVFDFDLDLIDWDLSQVHLIRLSSGGTELICEGLFSHPNEIWDLASCPYDQRIFSTVFSSGTHLDLQFFMRLIHFQWWSITLPEVSWHIVASWELFGSCKYDCFVCAHLHRQYILSIDIRIQRIVWFLNFVSSITIFLVHILIAENFKLLSHYNFDLLFLLIIQHFSPSWQLKEQGYFPSDYS